MGNHHGGHHHHHDKEHKSGETTPSSNGSRKSIVGRTLSDTTDSNRSHRSEITEKRDVGYMLPVERLAKILSEKTKEEEGVYGVTLSSFTKYLFPRYPILAEKLFFYLQYSAKSKTKTSHIPCDLFKQQCERYLGILEDDVVRDIYVKMFSKFYAESDSDMITPESMTSLLMCAYSISMDYYSEGPQMCFSINKTLKAVVDSCFHTKTHLSAQFVSHWLSHNCPRLLLPLHRYVVHSLATSYRTLEEHGSDSVPVGLELSTPVLEKESPFASKKSPHLLQMSMSWLLAGALPPMYSRPQRANSPNSSNVGLSGFNFLSKIICAVPSHWVLLYDSNEMGLGTNRFLHHVLSYKGPTLCLFRAESGDLFCVASPVEWKESHLYRGTEDSAVIQLLPKFCLLEKGPKLLYLNTTVRGYPHGLRAGSDPRNPILIIESGFDKMQFRKIPYSVDRIEVWGCGDQSSRETQLEIKKWEVKEAERQRNVKLSAADWLDHPDRYLLELAGRPQYHQNQQQ